MSNGFQASVHIDAPVETVWSRLTDWARASEWMNNIDDMRLQDGRPVGEGSRILFHSRGAERESTVVGWSPPQQLVLRSQQGGMTAVYEYFCQPEKAGTRLTLNAHCRAEGLGWKLASPLIGFMMKRADSGQVTALKQLIETGAH